ncbi:MAG: lytic murein transglycosylase [Pseudomonadota bacterium]
MDHTSYARRTGAHRLLKVLGVFLALSCGYCNAADLAFTEWLTALKAEAREQGISDAVLEEAFKGVEPLPRVLELDRNQPELKFNLEQYLERVLPMDRIVKARRHYKENHKLLVKIAKKYRVQPHYIVAFWGVESDFGRITGNFSVIAALATLAYDGRRAQFFRRELFNALKILNAGHISAAQMTGSWAGAMGQTQFMPSTFLNYGVDFDNDGKINIWNDLPDAFASAANYLHSIGWEGQQSWGREVKLPKEFDLQLVDMELRKTVQEWRKLRVRRVDGGHLPDSTLEASLVQPDGPKGRTYLVYKNYRMILNWNRSHVFAVAVGSLADRVTQTRLPKRARGHQIADQH